MSGGNLSRAPRPPLVLPLLLSLVLALGMVLGLPVRAAADGPTTFENATLIAIPGTGAADPQQGPASPYASTIVVSDMAGAVSKVTVTFAGLTHGALADVDAMVESPTGERLVVLSDVGDAHLQLVTTDNATLVFDDAAAGRVPEQVVVPSGAYRPTNDNPGAAVDTFPAPAPAPSSQTTLAGAFTGIDPNGSWTLYVVDDGSGEYGEMAGGWSLTVTTEEAAATTATTVTSSDATSTTGERVTFTATVRSGGSPVPAGGTVQFTDGSVDLGSPEPVNASGIATYSTDALTEGTHEIRATYSGIAGYLTSNGAVTQRVDDATVISDNTYCNTGPITGPGTSAGAATPYPSNVFVSGLAGQITNVTANLRGVTHTESQDLDILLSGPTPTSNLFLLSDVGRNADGVSNADLLFDDDAQTGVPSPIVNGTYRPTRASDESGDAMPGAAPAPTSATELGTFDGQSPNGTWSLWVVDDASGSSGSLSGGWCLTIEAQAETRTVLTAEPPSSIFDQSVTFTAAVTGGNAPVTAGRVQFSEGATVLDTVDLAADGTAPFTTKALAVGLHTITATYLGADNFAESDDDLAYVVSTRPTVTTVTSSDNPSDVGEAVTFTATVTDAGAPVTTGTVQFSIDGAPVGDPAAPNAEGQATYVARGLADGTYAVRATYCGTETLADSFGVLDPSQEVRLLQPTGTLTADPTTSQVSEEVTFTATFTVAGAPATPGTVQFSDGATTLCSDVAVNASGVATCDATFSSAADPHPIQATFARNDTYAEAVARLDYVVGLISTQTALADSSSTDVGDSVTFTATVTSGRSLVRVWK